MNRKKKQSLKNEIKNLKKNKKRAISFSRGKPASFKVITGRKQIMGKKELKNRIVLNYFLGSFVTILRLLRSTHIIYVGHHMLVSDRPKISSHSRNTIF